MRLDSKTNKVTEDFEVTSNDACRLRVVQFVTSRTVCNLSKIMGPKIGFTVTSTQY